MTPVNYRQGTGKTGVRQGRVVQILRTFSHEAWDELSWILNHRWLMRIALTPHISDVETVRSDQAANHTCNHCYSLPDAATRCQTRHWESEDSVWKTCHSHRRPNVMHILRWISQGISDEKNTHNRYGDIPIASTSCSDLQSYSICKYLTLDSHFKILCKKKLVQHQREIGYSLPRQN